MGKDKRILLAVSEEDLNRYKRSAHNNYATLSAVFMILWIFGFLEIIVSPVISALSQALFFVVKNVILFFI